MTHVFNIFFNILLIECGLLWMDSKPGLRVWYQNFIWTSIIKSSPKAFSVSHLNSICRCMCKSQEKLDAMNTNGHTVHKFPQWPVYADWVTPQDNICSCIFSKYSLNLEPSYIKIMQQVQDNQNTQILSIFVLYI